MKKFSRANLAICLLAIVQGAYIIFQSTLLWRDFVLTRTEDIAIAAVLSLVTIALTVVCVVFREDSELYIHRVWMFMFLPWLAFVLAFPGNLNRFMFGYVLVAMICALVLIFTTKSRMTLKIILGGGYAILTIGLAVLLILGLLFSGILSWIFGPEEVLMSSLSPNEVYYVEVLLWSGGAVTDFSNSVTIRRYPRGRRETIYSGRGFLFHGYDGIAPIYWDSDYAFRIYSNVGTRHFERVDGNWKMVYPVLS